MNSLPVTRASVLLLAATAVALAQPRPRISTRSLPAGTANVPFSTTLDVRGGQSPYSWSVAAGNLPQGLALSGASGAITGTPASPGVFDFTAQVTDGLAQTDTQGLRIVVNAAPLAIATTSLPAGSTGVAYSQTLAASGGVPPFSWTVSHGGLPPGLGLDQFSGTIAGTPAGAGTFGFTVRLTDSANGSANTGFSITVSASVSIVTTSLANGTVGVPYSQTIAAAGGSPPYTWSVTAGALPSGLRLDARAGAISGTPSAAGKTSFTVQVTDSALSTASQSFTIGVAAAPIGISTSLLPGGTVGTAYSQTIAASGGTPPYSWTITAGTLPSGLLLDSRTGTIGGTPSNAGNANFTVQVTDSVAVSATRALSIAIAPATLGITTSSLPGGTAGTAYSQMLAASGGTPPYSWSVTAGTLPPGLVLDARSGAISGMPTAPGNSIFTIRVADSASSVTRDFAIAIAPAAVSITTSSLPGGTVGTAYSQMLAASGGTPPYSWSVTAGTLPPGLVLDARSGAISGMPTAPGNSIFTIRVADSASSVTRDFAIAIAPAAVSITTSSLPGGTVGTAYSQALTASGGTPPYSWSVTAGTLPAGLVLDAHSGAISGMPTAAGNSGFTIRVADSASSVTRDFAIVIAPAAISITTSSLPGGTVGTAYSQALTASGGTPPYFWSVTAGTLPAGLVLDAHSGAISGMPTAPGNSIFTIRVADNASSVTRDFAIAIAPAAISITTSSLPGGTVGTAYSQALAAAGGTPPYSWSVTAGALPAGLVLDARSGAISGMPTTAGTSGFTIQVTGDTSATRSYSITITAVPIAITTAALPGAIVSAPYSQQLAATGGVPPYGWSLQSGTLPDGLSLTPAGSLSGTPGTPGTFAFIIQVADTAAARANRQYVMAVQGLVIGSPAVLPAGFAGRNYNAILTVTGGTPPYTWSVTSGSLPSGVTLNQQSGTLAGTPTAAGVYQFAAQASDAALLTTGKQFTLSVSAPLAVSTSGVLASGSVGVAYSQPLAAAGGSQPYTWSIASGVLPAGLALNGATGVIAGTPTSSGTFPFAAQVADSSSQQATANFTLTVAAGLIVATAPVLPGGTVGTPYSQKLTAAGGASPYTWSIGAGALARGIDLNPATGDLQGTPSAAGSFTFSAQVTDRNSVPATKQFTLAIAPALLITTAAIPDAAAGASYSQALDASGGTPPYLWTLASGALPSGLILESATGALAGTPLAAGDFRFTIQLTDALSTSTQKDFTLAVSPGLRFVTGASLPDATVGAAYAQTMQAAGGAAPYSWSVAAGSLPDGLALSSAAGAIAGTPAGPGTFNFTVQVTDAAGLTASRVYTVNASLPALPEISVAGLVDTLDPLQQPAVEVHLSAPFPGAGHGTSQSVFRPGGGGAG